jgi:hypothetical protein
MWPTTHFHVCLDVGSYIVRSLEIRSGKSDYFGRRSTESVASLVGRAGSWREQLTLLSENLHCDFNQNARLQAEDFHTLVYDILDQCKKEQRNQG